MMSLASQEIADLLQGLSRFTRSLASKRKESHLTQWILSLSQRELNQSCIEVSQSGEWKAIKDMIHLQGLKSSCRKGMPMLLKLNSEGNPIYTTELLSQNSFNTEINPDIYKLKYYERELLCSLWVTLKLTNSTGGDFSVENPSDLVELMSVLSDGNNFCRGPILFKGQCIIPWLQELPRFTAGQYIVALLEKQLWMKFQADITPQGTINQKQAIALDDSPIVSQASGNLFSPMNIVSKALMSFSADETGRGSDSDVTMPLENSAVLKLDRVHRRLFHQSFLSLLEILKSKDHEKFSFIVSTSNRRSGSGPCSASTTKFLKSSLEATKLWLIDYLLESQSSIASSRGLRRKTFFTHQNTSSSRANKLEHIHSVNYKNTNNLDVKSSNAAVISRMAQSLVCIPFLEFLSPVHELRATLCNRLMAIGTNCLAQELIEDEDTFKEHAMKKTKKKVKKKKKTKTKISGGEKTGNDGDISASSIVPLTAEPYLNISISPHLVTARLLERSDICIFIGELVDGLVDAAAAASTIHLRVTDSTAATSSSSSSPSCPCSSINMDTIITQCASNSKDPPVKIHPTRHDATDIITENDNRPEHVKNVLSNEQRIPIEEESDTYVVQTCGNNSFFARPQEHVTYGPISGKASSHSRSSSDDSWSDMALFPTVENYRKLINEADIDYGRLGRNFGDERQQMESDPGYLGTPCDVLGGWAFDESSGEPYLNQYFTDCKTQPLSGDLELQVMTDSHISKELPHGSLNRFLVFMPPERNSNEFVYNRNQYLHKQDYLQNSPDNTARHNLSNYCSYHENNYRSGNGNYYENTGNNENYQDFTNCNFNGDNSHESRGSEYLSRRYQHGNQNFTNSAGDFYPNYPIEAKREMPVDPMKNNQEENTVKEQNKDTADYAVISGQIARYASDITGQSCPHTYCEETVEKDIEGVPMNEMTRAVPVFLFHEERAMQDEMQRQLQLQLQLQLQPTKTEVPPYTRDKTLYSKSDDTAHRVGKSVVDEDSQEVDLIDESDKYEGQESVFGMRGDRKEDMKHSGYTKKVEKITPIFFQSNKEGLHSPGAMQINAILSLDNASQLSGCDKSAIRDDHKTDIVTVKVIATTKTEIGKKEGISNERRKSDGREQTHDLSAHMEPGLQSRMGPKGLIAVGLIRRSSEPKLTVNSERAEDVTYDKPDKTSSGVKSVQIIEKEAAEKEQKNWSVVDDTEIHSWSDVEIATAAVQRGRKGGQCSVSTPLLSDSTNCPSDLTSERSGDAEIDPMYRTVKKCVTVNNVLATDEGDGDGEGEGEKSISVSQSRSNDSVTLEESSDSPARSADSVTDYANDNKLEVAPNFIEEDPTGCLLASTAQSCPPSTYIHVSVMDGKCEREKDDVTGDIRHSDKRCIDGNDEKNGTSQDRLTLHENQCSVTAPPSPSPRHLTFPLTLTPTSTTAHASTHVHTHTHSHSDVGQSYSREAGHQHTPTTTYIRSHSYLHTNPHQPACIYTPHDSSRISDQSLTQSPRYSKSDVTPLSPSLTGISDSEATSRGSNSTCSNNNSNSNLNSNSGSSREGEVLSALLRELLVMSLRCLRSECSRALLLNQQAVQTGVIMGYQQRSIPPQHSAPPHIPFVKSVPVTCDEFPRKSTLFMTQDLSNSVPPPHAFFMRRHNTFSSRSEST